MVDRPIRWKLLLSFLTTALIFVALGLLFRLEVTKFSLLITATIVSAFFTGVYYTIVLVVRWIYAHYSVEGAEKLKYILAGALLLNLMPVFGVLELWPLLSLYSWPSTFATSVVGQHLPFLAVTISFWTAVGGILGFVVFRIRRAGAESSA